MLPGLLPSLLRSAEASSPRTLLDIIEAVALACPDAAAVDSGVETLTYTELLEGAAEVARRLADEGVGPGDKVGVRIKSGTVELYLGILGTMLSGAAYVPVDADDPDERARVVLSLIHI